MALDTSNLAGPINLEHDYARFLQEALRRGPNFAPANRAFSSIMSNPMTIVGPGGQLVDPNQEQAAAGQAYLGNRAGIAGTTNQQQGSFADLLTNAGTNIGDLSALMTKLNAQLIGSSGGGGFSGLGF